MKRYILAASAIAAITASSAANATITIGSSGSTSGTVVLSNVDSPVANKLTFDTIGASSGTTTSFFEFKESFPSTAFFALTTSDGTITLEQLLDTGGVNVLQTVSGSGFALSLQTGVLAANTFYRFRYQGSLGANGGNLSGTATFTAVPEPATWALMLLGFGGMGMVMRRRRQPALAQVA